MKTILLLALLASFTASAQTVAPVFPIDATTGHVTFEGVVPTEGINKADLYSHARTWFAKTFASADAVLQLEDATAGKLIGKGFTDIHVSTGYYSPVRTKLWFTMQVEVKDGRYRYEITDLAFGYYPGTQVTKIVGYNPAIKVPADEALTTTKGEAVKKGGEVRQAWASTRQETAQTVAGLAQSLQTQMATATKEW
ncbi:MAG: DUF4468 domain-containing protein [Janthinobacterium lividum]